MRFRSPTTPGMCNLPCFPHLPSPRPSAMHHLSLSQSLSLSHSLSLTLSHSHSLSVSLSVCLCVCVSVWHGQTRFERGVDRGRVRFRTQMDFLWKGKGVRFRCQGQEGPASTVISNADERSCCACCARERETKGWRRRKGGVGRT